METKNLWIFIRIRIHRAANIWLQSSCHGTWNFKPTMHSCKLNFFTANFSDRTNDLESSKAWDRGANWSGTVWLHTRTRSREEEVSDSDLQRHTHNGSTTVPAAPPRDARQPLRLCRLAPTCIPGPQHTGFRNPLPRRSRSPRAQSVATCLGETVSNSILTRTCKFGGSPPILPLEKNKMKQLEPTFRNDLRRKWSINELSTSKIYVAWGWSTYRFERQVYQKTFADSRTWDENGFSAIFVDDK